MARTKNRGLQQSFSPSYTVRRWRLGEYIRLSKEDLKKGKDDSNSIINQRDLLNDFYQKHIGEFESVSEYVDDGHTGTDANRENFQRLLSDVMSVSLSYLLLLVLISPFPRRNTINIFKSTGKMKLIFVSDSRADICNG